MKRSLALAGAALLLGAVAGCGGGDGGSGSAANSTEDYCGALEKAQKEFKAIETGEVTPANLGTIFDRMHELADQAPADISAEWRTLDGAISQMESGLKELGLSFKDMTDPQKLAEVDPQKLQQFGEDMKTLSGQKFNKASAAIEKHAQQECGIKLGKS